MNAIKEAINLIESNFHNEYILIASDSKSCLESLSNIYSKSNIINDIRTKISYSSNMYSFLWIPSHFKIQGNEKADFLAKNSLSQNISSLFKYQNSDLNTLINKYINAKWNDEWANEQSNKLREIITTIPIRSDKIEMTRTDFVKLTRLKIGHCNFTHRHVIDRTNAPYCTCGQHLTIKHIFNECTLLRNKLDKYKINSNKILLNDQKFQSIKEFLSELNLYNYI